MFRNDMTVQVRTRDVYRVRVQLWIAQRLLPINRRWAQRVMRGAGVWMRVAYGPWERVPVALDLLDDWVEDA